MSTYITSSLMSASEENVWAIDGENIIKLS